jgi:hypothetical protein
VPAPTTPRSRRHSRPASSTCPTAARSNGPARRSSRRRWRSPGACASTASTCPTRRSPRRGPPRRAAPDRHAQGRPEAQVGGAGLRATRWGWQVRTPKTPQRARCAVAWTSWQLYAARRCCAPCKRTPDHRADLEGFCRRPPADGTRTPQWRGSRRRR